MSGDQAQSYQARFGVAKDHDWPEEAYQALRPLLERRSIRKYKNEPISEGLLDLILACTQSAPAKSDLQQYSIVVLSDPARIAEISEFVPSNAWIAGAPVVLVFCGDINRSRRICAMHGRSHINDNVDSYTNTVTDAAIAMATCIRAAETVGLGCCPLSVIRNEVDAASSLLGIPKGVYPLAALGLGWPDETPKVSMRLPPSAVIHYERYDDTGLEHGLRDYAERRHERQPIPETKQRHPHIFGRSDHCTWTENVSRQLARPERPDLRAFLKRQGFSLD